MTDPLFLDTSALYAVLDRDDENHQVASACWRKIMAGDTLVVVSNYVIVEALALVQRRLGTPAIHTLCNAVLPALKLELLDAELHARAMAAFLTSGRRRLSFVDCSSFELMRSLGLTRVFAFDPHFAEQGFAVLAKG